MNFSGVAVYEDFIAERFIPVDIDLYRSSGNAEHDSRLERFHILVIQVKKDTENNEEGRTMFVVSCSVAEREKIKKLAKKNGMTISVYILWCCLKIGIK